MFPPQDREVAELPPVLRLVHAVWSTLGRDQAGSADLWGSGLRVLGTLGVEDPMERDRGLDYWSALDSASQLAHQKRREAAQS